MKKLILALPLLFSNLLHAESLQVELEKVEDGDTLVVNLKGQSERIQLLGIDAPEDTQNPKLKVDAARSGIDINTLKLLGQEATNELKKSIDPGDPLQLKGNIQQRDRYGRITAEVFSENNISLNVQMVERGFAKPLKPDSLPQALRDQVLSAWTQAEAEQRGLFSSQTEIFHAWLKVQK